MMQPPTTAELFVTKASALLEDDFLPKIAASVRALSDEDVWWRPNEASNSIGNLLLHLRGNVSQWILAGVGGRTYDRHRQQEFDARDAVTGAVLLDGLTAAVRDAVSVIDRQTGESLGERRRIQGYDVTVLEAIFHVVEHFSMHTGQIIMLAKMRTGQDLQLWRPPRVGRERDGQT